MSPLRRRRPAPEKVERTEAVLALLARSPNTHVAAAEVGRATGLGPAAYPLLAELGRLGAVEHAWLDEPSAPRLAYRLTLDGRVLASASRPVLLARLQDG
jgi:DNA-binding IclR family transcriptional regulator